MQNIILRIHDESKIVDLLALLRDLSYVEIYSPDEQDLNDVYAGIQSKLDADLLQSQLDILEKADW